MDTFLETQPTDFLPVAKAAIALSLIPLEADDNIRPLSSSEGWYRYLFEHMLQGAPRGATPRETFELNALTIVTFNFDRSFERALFQFVKRVFNLRPAAASTVALKTIPVWHIHGDLGMPAWLHGDSGECRRRYGLDDRILRDITKHDIGVPVVPVRDIQECAKRIRLVTDELPDSDRALSGARAALDAAEAVAFLGFAYDHRSLERLGIDRLNRIANVPDGHERAVYGTSHGMTVGNCGRVEATVRRIKLLNLRAHEFVEQWRALHGVADRPS